MGIKKSDADVPRMDANFLSGLWIRIGSGSGLDPDSVTLWIRTRIGNPDPGARKFQWKKCTLKLFFFKFNN
jgi:hypothetical protein